MMFGRRQIGSKLKYMLPFLVVTDFGVFHHGDIARNKCVCEDVFDSPEVPRS